MAKVAKLIEVYLKTRIIVDDTDTEDEIIAKARPQFMEAIKDYGENVELIEDDEEMPFDPTFDLVCLNCGEVTMSPYALTYEDALGKHCTCPNCEASFDVE